MPSHTPAKKKAAKKRKSMARRALDLAIKGRKSSKSRSGITAANKQLKKLEEDN